MTASTSCQWPVPPPVLVSIVAPRTTSNSSGVTLCDRSDFVYLKTSYVQWQSRPRHGWFTLSTVQRRRAWSRDHARPLYALQPRRRNHLNTGVDSDFRILITY